MPETDTTPVSASIASTGLGIRYIGNYAYAYSGALAFNDVATTLLEFTTGSGILLMDLLYMRNDVDGLDSAHRLYLNDILIATFPLSSGGNDRDATSPFIFPPLTKVKIDIINTQNTSNGSGLVALTGRVYGAE